MIDSRAEGRARGRLFKHKVPPLYSRADLPIHAKTGREWGPDLRALAYERRDDEV